ncbi:MAG TPA: glycoside hydrolase family 16 protein, partial [Pyrinomonadaceae bacterium]|nr:glycoside hydrolase family 16 protein [Pyrinomonadaceae bacterium]
AILVMSFVFVPVTAQKPKRLIFDDEFNGAANSSADSTKWTAEIGGGGWGNKELEYYTDSTANAYQDGSGSLVIKAIPVSSLMSLTCWYGPCKYISARLKTKGKFDVKYGRFEARIKIPRGQGVWPAFWLLGSDIGTVGWPQCGEIDIMENIGREPAVVHGTVHGPGYSGANGIGSPYKWQNGAFADDFHVYAVNWSADEIRWYVDGKQYKTLKLSDLPASTKWVFDHPFFLIINFAVGGTWPGDPDDTTAFPQIMEVDYVRVYGK